MDRRRPSVAGGAGNRNVPSRNGVVKVAGALTYEAAMRRIVARLGAPAVRKIAGAAERTVQDWCDPDSPRTCPIHIAEQLDRAWREAGAPGRPLADLLAARLQGATEPTSTFTLAEHFPAVLTETAQAKAALFVAIAPDASPTLRAVAAREVEESIAAFEATLPLLAKPTMTRAPPS